MLQKQRYAERKLHKNYGKPYKNYDNSRNLKEKFLNNRMYSVGKKLNSIKNAAVIVAAFTKATANRKSFAQT